jgi:digeranylgeranylglycerophospholipid reductase
VHDIVIIGAGPAGSMAAARLAARGLDVVVLEEHEEIGAPVHCTGLLGEEAFAEFDLPASLIFARASAASFWTASGQSIRIDSDRVRAAIIDRGALDRHLAARAATAGASVRVGQRVERVAVHADGVSVTGAGGEIRARICVLACGANYRFHRTLGLGLPAAHLLSAQLEIGFPAAPDIEVRLGRDVAPEGFAWMVPFERAGTARARIGLMSKSAAGPRFQQFASALASRAGVSAPLQAPRLKMLPLGPVPRTYADRVVAIGDAAGLVKPTTGGGIYYGLLSGTIAAEVIGRALETGQTDASALRAYELGWRSRLGSEIQAGLRFRRIASGMSDASMDALVTLARVDGVVPLLKEHASFNWHRKAAMALLGHPAFRQIAFKSWARSVRPF